MTLELASRGGGSIAIAASSLSSDVPPRARSTSVRKRSINLGDVCPIHRDDSANTDDNHVQCLARGCEKIYVSRAGFSPYTLAGEYSSGAHATKKIPSKLGSRFTNARYIVFGWRKNFQCFHMRSTPKV